MAKHLFEIMYQDFVMAPPSPPTSIYFVGSEELAKLIVKTLNGGVDRESGPGGDYFYTDPLVPYFETKAEWKAWLRKQIYKMEEVDDTPF